jgi:hypothetical protein
MWEQIVKAFWSFVQLRIAVLEKLHPAHKAAKKHKTILLLWTFFHMSSKSRLLSWQ